MAYNANWLALIVMLCFVVALVLNQRLPSLRPSRRSVQKRTNKRQLLAMLAGTAALLCFLVVADEFGWLWPRVVAFSAIVVTSVLAFDLDNWHQRAQLSGVLARLLLALLVSACAIAALFYAFPSRHLFRGVEALMVILAVCGVLTLRLVFLHQGRRKP